MVPQPNSDKVALRRAVLAQRDALPAPLRAGLAERITEHLLAQPAVAQARWVLGYLSFGSEVDTHPLLGVLVARGTRLALPRVNRETRRLDLHVVHDLSEDTAPGTWGIREPIPARCPLADRDLIDVVLAPGVAFTARGARLGYGGGFYDRLLGPWQPRPPVLAACYGIQLLDTVPEEANDVRVDVIVTESGTFTPSR